MISERLKKIIFDKLYKDLGKAEIINYNGNIWFIDREKKYWYFELTKDGILWWRYSFFESFFALFSFDFSRFEPIIKDWVEEVLNYKVNTTRSTNLYKEILVEEVLNYKVNTTSFYSNPSDFLVKEVLNHKVNTTVAAFFSTRLKVEEVLNYKVTRLRRGIKFNVEEVLNYKVNKTSLDYDGVLFRVEEVLNHSVKEDKNTHCHYSDLPSPSAYEE